MTSPRSPGSRSLHVQTMATKGIGCATRVGDDPSFGSVIAFGARRRHLRPARRPRLPGAAAHGGRAPSELIDAPRTAPLLDGYRQSAPADRARWSISCRASPRSPTTARGAPTRCASRYWPRGRCRASPMRACGSARKRAPRRPRAASAALSPPGRTTPAESGGPEGVAAHSPRPGPVSRGSNPASPRRRRPRSACT